MTTSIECGFEIGIYSQDLIEENAKESFGGNDRQGFGEDLVTLKGEVTSAGWEVLNRDIATVEHNSMAWLRGKFVSAVDHGHDSDSSLVGSISFDPTNRVQCELIELASREGRSERICMSDATFGDLSKTVWKGVSHFGQTILGGAITFFGLSEDAMDQIEATLEGKS